MIALEEHIKRKGWSQSEAARRFSVTQPRVSDLMRGKITLFGLDTLILGAVRYEPHPTHFNLAQALEVIATLKPKRAFLTHLSHYFDHDTVNRELPGHVRLAYDGLKFTVPGAAD